MKKNSICEYLRAQNARSLNHLDPFGDGNQCFSPLRYELLLNGVILASAGSRTQI